MNEPRSGHPPEDDHSGIDIDIQSVDYLKKIVQHFMDRKKQAFPPNLADDMLRDVISWNHRERTLSFRKNDNQGHVSSYPEEVYLGRRFLLLSDAGLDVMYSLLAYVSATRLEDSEVLKKRREMRNAFTPLLTRASRCYWEAFQSQPVSTIHDHPNQRVLPPPALPLTPRPLTLISPSSQRGVPATGRLPPPIDPDINLSCLEGCTKTLPWLIGIRVVKDAVEKAFSVPLYDLAGVEFRDAKVPPDSELLKRVEGGCGLLHSILVRGGDAFPFFVKGSCSTFSLNFPGVALFIEKFSNNMSSEQIKLFERNITLLNAFPYLLPHELLEQRGGTHSGMALAIVMHGSELALKNECVPLSGLYRIPKNDSTKKLMCSIDYPVILAYMKTSFTPDHMTFDVLQKIAESAATLFKTTICDPVYVYNRAMNQLWGFQT